MTEPELRDLLDQAVGDPPRLLDADALLAEAGRRRTGHLVGSGVGLAALTLAAALILPPLLAPPGELRVAAPATPTRNPASAPGAVTPLPPCPTPDPATVGRVAVDYATLLTHGGRRYDAALTRDAAPTPGEPVLTVRCSIDEISQGGHALVREPWPDGTSTFLPRGTVVSAIPGHDPGCYLTATATEGTWVLRALGPPEDPWATPAGCVRGYGPWGVLVDEVEAARAAERAASGAGTAKASASPRPASGTPGRRGAAGAPRARAPSRRPAGGSPGS